MVRILQRLGYKIALVSGGFNTFIRPIQEKFGLDYAFANQMLTLANPAPLDWFAGALLGAPIGMSWAGSLVHKRLADAKSASAA